MALADELQADTLERFLRYVRVDTQSDHSSETRPSTERQLDLSRLLRDELAHATIRVGFTTDEETGHGTDHFDLERFGADFAYTVDGGEVGEIENETFSAVELKVTFPGKFVHPGYAKGKLVNPIKLAAAFIEKLPKDGLSPETTEGREGYVHPLHISGSPEECTVTFLLRDHDNDKLEEHDALVRRLAQEVSPDATFTRWDQYRNMREQLDEVR